MADDESLDEPNTPLRYRQGRFEGRGMPLAAIDDLRQYQLLLKDAARAIWIARHPNAKRVPKRVLESVELRLVDFQPGSVVPVLEREATLDLRDDYDVLDEAQALVDTAFAAIIDGRVADYRALGLPEARLRSFGKRLTGTERVELSSRSDSPVTYSKELRRVSIERADAVDRNRDHDELVDLMVVGLLRGLETTEGGGTFKLKPLRGREISGKFDDAERFEDLRRALEQLDGSSFVRLKVRALESDQGSRIESVTQVEQFDVEPSPWRDRLRALLAGNHEWDDTEDIEPPRIEDLEAIDLLLHKLPKQLGLNALIGVMPDGHGFVEWIGHSWLARVDIDDAVRFTGYSKMLGSGPGERLKFEGREQAAKWVVNVTGAS